MSLVLLLLESSYLTVIGESRLAVSFSVILLLTSIGLKSVDATVVTTLRLNTNVEKGIPPTQGETIVLSGQLIRADTLEGVPNATINIFQYVQFGRTQLLASGKTDTDGSYLIPWTVDVTLLGANTEQRSTSSTHEAKVNRMPVTIFAKFAGNDKYAASVSGEQSFEVRLNALSIKIEKQGVYLPNQKAVAKIIITDIDNNLVDPDTLKARFDSNAIYLPWASTGTYFFYVPSLSPGAHQLEVWVEKKLYIPASTFITVEAMKRKTSLVISLDKSSYKFGETVNIAASLIDKSSGEPITDKVISGALTSPSLALHQLRFVDGKASYTLARTDVAGTWLVWASFLPDNSYFGSAAQASFTVTSDT